MVKNLIPKLQKGWKFHWKLPAESKNEAYFDLNLIPFELQAPFRKKSHFRDQEN